jgi:hypothetical protein
VFAGMARYGLKMDRPITMEAAMSRLTDALRMIILIIEVLIVLIERR